MKVAENYRLEYIGKNYEGLLCTKPKNKVRFLNGLGNWNNREVDPYRYRHGATCLSIYYSNTFTLFHLFPDDNPLIHSASNLLSVSDLKYDPWFDIDRYAVKCLVGNPEVCGCPVFQRLRQLVSVEKLKDIPPYVYKSFARVEEDPEYGEVGKTYVGYGNGDCGPIAADFCGYRWNPFGGLSSLCASCATFRSYSENKNDNSNGGFDEEFVMADKKFSHGGIIAFFKRLFGRRAEKGER